MDPTTAELLVDEHAVLIEQVTTRTEKILQAVAGHRWPADQLQRLIDYLHDELLDQTVHEERLLFPAAGGCSAEQIRPLLADHAALRRSVEELTRLAADAAPTPDADQLLRVMRSLRRMLSAHAVREERALAPVTLDGVGARRRPAWSRTWYWLLETPVLDLDALPACSVAEAVTRRLARLRVGDSVEIRCSRDAAAVRTTLARRRSAGFSETGITGGPQEWRRRITRLE
ncbi:hemerythrin domain-containing protein [Geodermatophilus sp. URMC 64]